MRALWSSTIVLGLVGVAGADDKPTVLLAPDEAAIAYSGHLCNSGVDQVSKCDHADDAKVAGYTPIVLQPLKNGWLGVLHVRLDRAHELVRINSGDETLTSIHSAAKPIAVAITPRENAIVALDDGTTVLVADEHWIAGGGHSWWRILISSDGTRVAAETEINAAICGGSVDTCQAFIFGPDSPNEEEIARYNDAITAGHFRAVRMHPNGKLGRLRTAIVHHRLTVSRDGHVIAKVQVGDERLGALALAPSGELVIVFRSLRSLRVPVD